MKNLIFAAMIVLAFITGVNAQRRFSVKDRVNQLKDSLSLSDTQTAQVDSIYSEMSKKMQALRESGQVDRDAMRQIMEDTDKQIENILTPEQKDKYEQMMANRRSQMRQGPPPDNGGGAPPDGN